MRYLCNKGEPVPLHPPPGVGPSFLDKGKEVAGHVADSMDTIATRVPHQCRREIRTASGVLSGAGGAGCCVGRAASEPAPGERARLAGDDTESAARLLEYAFVSTVEVNELFMPAVEQLYAALQEAEASAAMLEARFSRGHRRG